MNLTYFGQRLKYSLVLLFMIVFSANAQVSFSTNLSGTTSEICAGSYKKLSVSVLKGTCAAFSGDVNSVNFDWEIETSPGIWVPKDSYSIPGVTYSIEKRINSGGTVISNILTVNTTSFTPEVVLKYRVSARGSGGCPAVLSTNESVAIKYYRWLGSVDTAWENSSNWSCGKLPPSSSVVIIPRTANSATISSAVTVREIIVEDGARLLVNSGNNLTVNGPVTVQGTGDFVLQNNANLMQSSYTGPNSGKIKVGRNSSALVRLDYTLWSSPVSGQNLLSFSPQTLTNRFYVYNSDTNLYNVITPSTNDFQIGKGYLIRTSNVHPTTPTVWNGFFTGVPNNGDIPLTMYNGGAGKRFNAVGNPYPSPIKMSSFVTSNIGKMTGTIYFWRKSNSTTTEPGYCTWTSAGFVSNGEAQVFNPNGIIRTGQGFFVEMANNETDIVFNNSMRIANNADQFFRNSENDNSDAGIVAGDKIKLNVKSTVGYRNQMLLGYFEGATKGVDFALDGKVLENYPVALVTEIDDEDYLIQGRPSFEKSDTVALKFKTESAGEFEIAVEELEGIFLKGQEVFLRDKFLNKVHNLNYSGYRFASDSGSYHDRFELFFDAGKNELNSSLEESRVVVYKEQNQLLVKSDKLINSVQVYDIKGRFLAGADNLATTDHNLYLTAENEVLLIKVTTQDGSVFNRKIIF